MPELPEVQTVVSDLNKKIKNDKIVDFWSDWSRAIKNKTLKKFKEEIIGRKILEARRIGKNIFIDLSGGKTLYIHLKMTGHLLVKEEKETGKHFKEKVNQYIHHKWMLEGGKSLEFSDLRKFGKIVLLETKKIDELPEIKALGVDALDKKFTFKKFQEILEKRPKKPIGILLMDQNLIAGIGNIYRSEILFAACVKPTRRVETLELDEKKNIFLEIKKILKKAVKLRGTTDSDYRDTSGAPGKFQKVLRVYRKEGEKCQKCGKIILRSTMGQRSVFHCEKCQK